MAAAGIAGMVLPGVFDPNSDNWCNYKEQLYFALEAAGPLNSEQKRALFLSQCGKQAFNLIVSLLSPNKPSEVSFEDIIAVIDKFFIPRPHPILETQKFYARKQKSNEHLTTFVAALHDIGSRCAFQSLQRRIIEQLILGLHSESIRRELLKMKFQEMTYDAVLQRAINLEALQHGKPETQYETNSSSNHHGGAQNNTNNNGTNRNSCEPMEVNAINIKQCEHCAKRHLSKCRYCNATCHACKKKGHTKWACKEKQNNNLKQQKNSVNKCNECMSTRENVITESESEDNHGIYTLSPAGVVPVKPYMVEVTINGVPVTMEVDSGASRSILPHRVYLQHRDAFPGELKKYENKLTTWTNDVLKVKGETTVKVEYNGIETVLPLLVSCGKGPALLGRAWFEALGISVQGVNSLNEEEITIKFPNLFSERMDEYKGPPVAIKLRDGAVPIFLKARPVPFPLKEKVNQEINKMIKDKIITPVKTSQWATPICIVPKPDGSLRLCGDYRSTVNKACEADSYPLPTANEAFFQLSGSKYFTKLDLKHAYFQLKVDNETAEVLTLNTPLGLMRMNRLAFGVNAATAIFQRIMSALLAGVDGVACLLDDVVVSGTTLEEHDGRLELVLNRLDEVGLKLNKKKCVFAERKVQFLGYKIDGDGVHPMKEKIQEIADKPAPKDKKSLKAFLGLYNFYERFIKEKAAVLQPLYKLLKENVEWQWGKVELEAFEKAKALLTSDLTLTHYSLQKELLLICDASEYGVGAVLAHKMEDGTEKPVIMGSRTLQEHERRYAQIDKEALAIMFGLKKFRQYLMGRKFTIYTDHKPLLGIFGRSKPIPEIISSRMLRWALTLNTFDYNIEYRAGKDMGNADSLSRFPSPSNEVENEEEVFLLEQTEMMRITSKLIAKETDKDPILRKVKNLLLHGWPDKTEEELEPFHRKRNNLSLNKECIMWANRVVIPTTLQKKVLKALHEGHDGMIQTKRMARAYLWFPSLNEDIEKMIGECDACQLNRNNPPETQHTWTPETRPWSRIHIDFMGPFMEKTFLVVVDAYSKWPVVEMIPSMSSKTVIDILRRTFADHGLPEIIVSDNGLAFTSKEFQEFTQRNNIKHLTGAPYHPATNGQVERTIQTIKMKIKKQSQQPWPERIARMLFQMRTVPNSVTNKSPAELLNGRRYRTMLSQLHPDLDYTITDTEEGEERRNIKKTFSDKDHVLFRIYNNNIKWMRGVVEKMVAPGVYVVIGTDGSRHRRHVDQMLRSGAPGTKQNQTDYNGSESEIVIPPPEEWPDIIGV